MISKSEQKRQVKALTSLGERLVQLPDATLNSLPIPDNLLTAINRAQKITKRGGRRRELLFIGKILRSIDANDIITALETIDEQSQEDKETFHQIEDWRDKLINNDEGLKAFIDEYPNTDIQLLRQYLRNYKSAKKPEQKTKVYRQIFQLIKVAFVS